MSENIIVIGAGEKDYWARVEGGVIVSVYPVEREPRQIAGINTDVIPVLRERFPDAEFIKLPEPRVHGVGWLYNSTTQEFSLPAEEPLPLDSASPRDIAERFGLSKESFDAIVSAVRAELAAESANEET